MAASSSGHSQVSDDIIANASIMESQDANFAVSGVTSIPHASGLLADTLECEYEPQSTDFINVFTPSNDNDNMADQSQSTIWDMQSQNDLVLQQSDIESLDSQLENLPSTLYVQRLLHITGNNEEMVLWYRGVLCSRAKNHEGCPKGNPKSRKTTKGGLSIQKYATDCYGINLFLHGDPSKVDEIFDGKTGVITPKPLSAKVESVEIRVTVQTLLSRVKSLEQTVKAKDSLISGLKSELADLNKQHKDLKGRFDKLEGEITPKVVNLESFRKQSQNQLKSVDGFDYEIYLKNKETIENKIQQISKTCSSIKKCQQSNTATASYAAVVRTPPRPPHSPVNTAHLETGDLERNADSPAKTDQSIQSASTRDISIIEEINDSYITARADPVLDDSTNSNDFVELRFADSVRKKDNVVGRTGPKHSPSNSPKKHKFVGVSYKRRARFYLWGIGNESTREGILEFMDEQGIKVTHLVVFKPKSPRARLSAKINVDYSHAHLLESEGFWPDGVKCRRWLSAQRWEEKCTKDTRDWPEDDYRDDVSSDNIRYNREWWDDSSYKVD